MNSIVFYTFLRKQIPVMIFLSLLPGIAYVIFGYIHNIFLPALFWYVTSAIVSLWGYLIYKSFDEGHMSLTEKQSWYRKLSIFFYIIFSLWTVIFLLYVIHDEKNMHYIAIFTELGASVVAATLLFPDKRLFIPILAVLMLPLAIYFAMVGYWYTYLLSIFSLVFMGVLYYSSFSSNKLIHQSNYQASHDMLTGLHNRHIAISLLQETINSLKDENSTNYILLIDLDHFKIINDTLGHDIGDLLLQEVAQRMRYLLDKDHYIARLGGDEFIIIGHKSDHDSQILDNARDISYKLLHDLKQTYHIQNHHLYISASIGISIINDKTRDAHEFIKEADIAMYEVKSSGKDNVFTFDQNMSKKIQRQLELEKILPFALEDGEFYLNFQPQMSPQGKILGCECLARWRNQEYGLIPPSEFIPLAEQSTQIIKLGLFLIENAFKTLLQWEKDGIELEQFSINLSIQQLFAPHFCEDIIDLSDRYLSDRLRKKVIFEITESMAAKDINQLIQTINKLKRYNFRFSLDDFGTGYSSLSYLRQIPIDELKIDRSFIMAMNRSDQDNVMIDVIFTLAKSFNFSIVAEGIEDQSQLDFLKKYECHIIQGFLFSQPLDKKEFEAFYQKNQSS